MENKNNLNEIAYGLALFFKDEPWKIAIWLLTKNPNFGGYSPAELIALREEKGLEKVAKFILTAKEENLC
jgi:hypothetical protein